MDTATKFFVGLSLGIGVFSFAQENVRPVLTGALF